MPASAGERARFRPISLERATIDVGAPRAQRPPVSPPRDARLPTDASGRYVFNGLPAGDYTVTFTLQGFLSVRREGVTLRAWTTATIDATLQIGALAEMVTVAGEASTLLLSGSLGESEARGASVNSQRRQDSQVIPPSQAVINLQQRAAGVLPVRIEVPRAGTSHQFVRLLASTSRPTWTSTTRGDDQSPCPMLNAQFSARV